MSQDIEGLKKLLRQLKTLTRSDGGKALRRSARAAIQEPLQRARAAIPVGVDEHRTYKGRIVQPGFAKRSIRAIVTVSRDKKKVEAILGVKAEAFYAVQFVELGTTKTPARPWLRPAFQSSEAQQISTLSTELRNAITGAVRK